MAILNKDEFTSRLKARLGDDTSDEAMSFLEDFTDTFNDLESRANDTTNWKEKFEQNDSEWRDKYKARFFEGSPSNKAEDENETEPEPETFDDLFS